MMLSKKLTQRGCQDTGPLRRHTRTAAYANIYYIVLEAKGPHLCYPTWSSPGIHAFLYFNFSELKLINFKIHYFSCASNISVLNRYTWPMATMFASAERPSILTESSIGQHCFTQMGPLIAPFLTVEVGKRKGPPIENQPCKE